MRTLLLALALLVLLAPAAGAASRSQIIRDCSDDGRLQGNYSASELRDARQNLPADIDQYTDCREVLRRAELAASSSGGAGGAWGLFGGGSPPGGIPEPGALLTPASPAEEAALAEARRDSGGPLRVAGRQVEPGAAPFSAFAASHALPWHVVAVLVLLGLAALAAAAPPIHRRVLARRGQPA
jgi:hypothetical protein